MSDSTPLAALASPEKRWSAPPPSAVVFDCDGVLLNTERYCLQSKIDVLADHGVAATRAIVERLKGRHYSVAGAVLAEILGDGADAGQASEEARRRQIELYHSDDVAALPGALDIVAAAAARGPVAVASASPHPAVVHGLEVAGFVAYVDPDHVVCPDAAGLPPKPDPAVYLEALRRLDVAPAGALAVEDSGSGLRSARAAGMRVLGVGSRPPVELVELADLWVETLADAGLRAWFGTVALTESV
jgi:HAD superfamily hydrolase (TIGR01509 family)